MSIQVSSVLKNHELRLNALEGSTSQNNDKVDISHIESQLRSSNQEVTMMREHIAELEKKMTELTVLASELKQQHNDMNELYTRQRLEYLKQTELRESLEQQKLRGQLPNRQEEQPEDITLEVNEEE